MKDAVNEVMNNPLYKNNVSMLAEEMNTYDANALSIGYIEELIGEASVVKDK